MYGHRNIKIIIIIIIIIIMSDHISHVQHSETNFKKTLISWTFVKFCQSIPSFVKTRK